MAAAPTPSPDQVGLTVDLRGIIQIFGSSLYNEFSDIVRELVQNGHDGVVELYAEGASDAQTLCQHWVNVRYDGQSRLLVLSDDGKGMDRTDVGTSLNNFGRPNANKLAARETIAASSNNARLHIIGRYGVGFLSAMAVSDRVEVWTQKLGSNPVLWLYQDGESVARMSDASPEAYSVVRQRYSLRSADAGSPGTVVVCRLKQNVEEQYNITPEAVRAGLIRHTRLLQVPIYFNGERITDQSTAWSNPAAATKSDWREMIVASTGSDPLLVIPVYSPPTELDLEGVLWIPPRSSFLGEDGRLDVFVCRMFVTQDDSVLLPRWARFIIGMINSNKMERVVSGNAFMNDMHASKVRDFIKSCILRAFEDLLKLPEEDYWRVIGEHDDIIKISAAEDEDFLDCVWDKLRIRARSHRLTIPQYLEEVHLRTGKRDVIYSYSKVTEEFAAGVVSDTTGIPVVSLWATNDEAFVQRACRRQHIRLLPYTELAAIVIKRPKNEEAYQILITACAAKGIAADVREYEPDHMPAMLVADENLQAQRERLLDVLRQSDDYKNTRIANELQKSYLLEHAANRGVSFYLNAGNSLINELLTAPFDIQQAVCLALYNISYLSIVPELRKDEVQAIYRSICNVLLTILPPKKTPTSPRPTQLFMMTPYGEDYRAAEDAVREFFEGPPYFFKVVLGRDFMLDSNLLEHIRAHIDSADAYIAEVTEQKPNVMLELGAVVIKRDPGRPVFALKAATATDALPSNIKEVLCISYGSRNDDQTKIVADIRNALELNGRPSHRELAGLLERRSCRALTRTLLKLTRARLQDDEERKILNSFSTVEKLVDNETTPERISRESGLAVPLARLIQDQIRTFVANSAPPPDGKLR